MVFQGLVDKWEDKQESLSRSIPSPDCVESRRNICATAQSNSSEQQHAYLLTIWPSVLIPSTCCACTELRVISQSSVVPSREEEPRQKQKQKQKARPRQEQKQKQKARPRPRQEQKARPRPRQEQGQPPSYAPAEAMFSIDVPSPDKV